MKEKTLRLTILYCFLILLLSAVSCGKEEKIVVPVIPADTIPKDPAQYETPFADVPNTPDITMYEINERAFSTSGNFAGILPRLDSIKALGVNVIWLMPIHPIGIIKTVNSPYCIRNYKEVNPEYGTLEDLRTLVREAHKRKMAVILDWAANHTSWDNPWISNKAWYTQDGNGNIINPAGTNWQDVADLNFDNSAMRLEMIKSLKYWVLTANIDGYRCDAADYVPFSFWKQAIDSLTDIPNRKLIMLAEGSRADHFAAGFRLNFSWDFFAKNKSVFKNNQLASGLYSTHLSEYASIPLNSHKLRFTSNHDECAWDDTPLGLFGGKQASMAAFVFSAFMGGVTLIYNGQEVGCPVKLPFFSRSPINWTTNPDMLAEYKFLLNLRAAHPALRSGDLVSFSGNDIAAFERQTQDEKVAVFVNTRNSARPFTVPANLKNISWKDAVNGMPVVLDSLLVLNAFEYRILIK
jgi:glycosidase